MADRMEFALDLLERAARARRHGEALAPHPAGQSLLAFAEELEAKARETIHDLGC